VPRISIIIPNLNSKIIDLTLDALQRQEFDLSQIEVLVIGLDDQGLIQENELVRWISTDVPATPAVARNIGMQEAKGDLFCFTDADCIPETDWLARLTAPFKDADNSVVGGGVAFEAKNYWTLCDNLSWFYEYLSSASAGGRNLLPSLNLCVRRQVVDKVGLFDTSYPSAAGEDAEWTTRMRQAGFGLNFVPTAIVYHRPSRASFAAICRHAFRYGRHSIKIKSEYSEFLQTPVFLRKWWAVLLLSPLLATSVTVKVFMFDRALWRYWYALPGILLSKIVWCLGAARSLWDIKA